MDQLHICLKCQNTAKSIKNCFIPIMVNMTFDYDFFGGPVCHDPCCLYDLDDLYKRLHPHHEFCLHYITVNRSIVISYG